jgi:hypothetical protein
MEVEIVFACHRSVFGRISKEKQPKPSVRPVKPPPQPSKNAPLLDKRLPGLTGQKNDLEEVVPGLD